jgi:hypothetical protein
VTDRLRDRAGGAQDSAGDGTVEGTRDDAALRQLKWGSHPEGDEEVASTLPVSCNLQVEVLLLCGVTVAHKKEKGGEPVDDSPLRLGDKMRMGGGWPLAGPTDNSARYSHVIGQISGPKNTKACHFIPISLKMIFNEKYVFLLLLKIGSIFFKNILYKLKLWIISTICIKQNKS